MLDSTTHISSETPEVIYHYTSIASLHHIIGSGELWASSINYLNDVSERQLFLNAVSSRLAFTAGLKGLNLPLFQTMVEQEASAGPVQNLPFVASFTRHRNSLPQWRAYCAKGNGVSIGFKTSRMTRDLFSPANNPSIHNLGSPSTSLHAVTYLEKLDTVTVDRLLIEDWDEVQWLFGLPTTGPEALFSWRIKSRACIVKDASFLEEGEYRLVAHNVNARLSGHILGTRPTATTLVPYVRVPLSENAALEESSLPICELVVGPCPNPDLTIRGLEFFAEIHGLDVTVSYSELPYRDL